MPLGESPGSGTSRLLKRSSAVSSKARRNHVELARHGSIASVSVYSSGTNEGMASPVPRILRQLSVQDGAIVALKRMGSFLSTSSLVAADCSRSPSGRVLGY